MQAQRRTSVRLLFAALAALAAAWPAAPLQVHAEEIPAAEAAAVTEITATSGETILPSRMCGRHILVDMAVNGDPDRILTMILDTGASHTVIDPDSVYRVSGQHLKKDKWADFKKLTVGPVTFSNVSARGSNLDHISRALGDAVDGILGFSAFTGTLLTLDYPAREVRIGRGRLDPDEPDVYPLASRENKRPWLKLQIAGRTRTVLIDSGSGSGLLLHRSNSYTWLTEPLPVRSSMRINRLQLREMGRLEERISFGPAELVNPLVELTSYTPLVGTAILKHFVMTFDQESRLLRMQYPGEGPVMQDSLRGTGLVFNPTRAGLEVVRVLEGSPAARARLSKGDLVTAMDGRSVHERECGGFAQRMTDEDKNLVLTITHKGKSRDVLVDVVDIIP